MELVQIVSTYYLTRVFVLRDILVQTASLLVSDEFSLFYVSSFIVIETFPILFQELHF